MPRNAAQPVLRFPRQQTGFVCVNQTLQQNIRFSTSSDVFRIPERNVHDWRSSDFSAQAAVRMPKQPQVGAVLQDPFIKIGSETRRQIIERSRHTWTGRMMADDDRAAVKRFPDFSRQPFEMVRVNPNRIIRAHHSPVDTDQIIIGHPRSYNWTPRITYRFPSFRDSLRAR